MEREGVTDSVCLLHNEAQWRLCYEIMVLNWAHSGTLYKRNTYCTPCITYWNIIYFQTPVSHTSWREGLTSLVLIMERATMAGIIMKSGTEEAYAESITTCFLIPCTTPCPAEPPLRSQISLWYPPWSPSPLQQVRFQNTLGGSW